MGGGKEKAGRGQCLQGSQVIPVDLEDDKVLPRHLERGGWSLGNPGRFEGTPGLVSHTLPPSTQLALLETGGTRGNFRRTRKASHTS